MENLTNINTLLETGGSFAIICGLVYFILKYIFEYLKCRDQRDEENVAKRYEERREERDIKLAESKEEREVRLKEHTMFCETIQKQAEEFKEAVIALINKDKKD